jgi:hypothetical protein
MTETSGTFMRWILLIAAIVGFAIAFTTPSPGLMGLGLIVGCVGIFGFGLSLAAARIAMNSQSESMMIADPDIRALRAKAQASKSAKATPATDSGPDRPAL